MVQQRAARSAAEWSPQLMMLDHSNNMTFLIVSHGPMANRIPAIRGLWWSISFLWSSAAILPPFFINLTNALPAVDNLSHKKRKSKLQYEEHNMINGERSEGIGGVRSFSSLWSLITENITWCNASEDCRPLHFPDADRGLVQTTGGRTGEGLPEV